MREHRIAGGLVAGLVALVQLAGAGNLCTWTGGAGDGKWSSAANWDTAPVSGNNDLLAFRGDTALTVSNDVANFSVGGLIFSGSGAKSLVGQTVALAGRYIKASNNGGTANARSYSISNASPTVISAPLACVGDAGVVNCKSGATSFESKGTISIAAGKTFRVGDAYAWDRDAGAARHYTFSGPIDGPEGTIQFSSWSRAYVYLDAPVDVKDMSYDYPANPIYLPTQSRSVRIRSGTTAIWYGYLHFRAADTFAEDGMVLNWSPTYYQADRSSYQLNGHSQTIDRLGTSFINKVNDAEGNAISSASAATLTCRASANCTTFGIVRGALSFVWDPQGDYTCTFTNRVSDTTGSITVKRGTFRMTGACTFANATAIAVADDADFELKSTSATAALKGLTDLRLGARARFVVGTETVQTPFSAGTVVLRMKTSSRVEIPSGKMLNVMSALVDGIPLAAGTYTGAAAPGAGETALAQLVGDGTLVVAGGTGTLWTGAADANLGTAANWTAGVPTTSLGAFIYKEGTFTLNLADSPAAAFGDLTMEQDADGTGTLNIGAPLRFADSAVTLGRGARMTVGNGVRVDYACRTTAGNEDNVFTVKDGGELFIDGGTFVSSNLYGRIAVEKGGTLRMEGGEFHAAPPANKVYGNALYVNGGTVALTNATMRLGYNFNNGSDLATGRSLLIGGGATFLAHNTYLRLDQWFWRSSFGTGEAILSGTTTLSMHHYIRGGVTADRSGETARLVLRDSAKISGTQEFAVGDNVEGAKSYLVLESPGVTVSGSSGLQMGCNMGYGEIEVKAGYLVGGGAYGIHIGGQSPEDGQSKDGVHPTGVLKVSGGGVTGSGQIGGNRPFGIEVGDGTRIPITGTSHVTGRLEISGTGVVTNNVNNFMVGLGRADGTVTMTGGRLVANSGYPAVIGFCGGTGVWTQSGGTASFNADLNVGGASTNQLDRGGWTDANAPESCKTAKGRLEVTGGELSLTGTLGVSRDGEGTLRLGGAGRIVAAAATFTNTWDAVNGVTYPAHLAYTLTPDGAGELALTGAATLAAGTTLSVDLTGYSGRQTKFRLIQTPTLNADLAQLDISIVDTRATGERLDRIASIAKGADGLYLRLSRGTALLFR